MIIITHVPSFLFIPAFQQSFLALGNNEKPQVCLSIEVENRRTSDIKGREIMEVFGRELLSPF